MQIKIKPEYYDSFSCIADSCSFTCCQEWKIAVDDETLENWKQNKNENGRKLSDDVIIKDGEQVMKLNDEKRCPHLNSNGLCKLVLKYGEEILSTTCDTFPRQIHEFENRTEYSLVSCCPEVIDIWNKTEKIKFLEDGKLDHYDILYAIRSLLIEIMQNTKFSVEKDLLILFFSLLDIYGKENLDEITLDKYSQEKFIQNISDAIDGMQFSSYHTFEERNELFLDLVDNYRKQEMYTDYLEPIALLAEEISEDYEGKLSQNKLDEFNTWFASHERLIRNFLVAEIFTNILIPDSDLKSMVVMAQWMAMEYVAIKHAIYLRWYLNGEGTLSYTTVRDYIIVVSRMTGYDQEDIYEYLEDSFENLIWDWGYFALIIGR